MQPILSRRGWAAEIAEGFFERLERLPTPLYAVTQGLRRGHQAMHSEVTINICRESSAYSQLCAD
jgi:hypothetical protein